MATTTNYGWTTPNDTDLVKDGAAAIRTLGSSVDTTTKNLNPQTTTGAIAYRSATANVNTALPLGTANQVLRVNSGGTAPEWATTADQTPLTTKGDLFGFDTADARIPIGTNGHILTADSTQSLGLKWAAPAGGGKVLQVVSATYSTEVNVASTTYTDTGLSLAITPSAATSKILILVTQSLYSSRDAGASGGAIRILKDATSIFDPSGSSFYAANLIQVTVSGITGTGIQQLVPLTFLDSPNTTSSITYKTQIRAETTSNSGRVMAQLNSSTSTITLLEIGA
jgi:hypothetical protein